ncbi:MAG: FkbM family methyltransferase [Pirellulales bacterium]
MNFNTAFTLRQRLAFWDAHPLYGSVPIVLPCRHRPFVMHSDNDDTVVKTLHWGGFFAGWEPTSLRLWSALAAGASQVFDVGAYTGIYGLLAATSSDRCRVICIEGCSRNHDRLVHNVALNGLEARIACMHAVAAQFSGPTVLYERYAADGILSSVHSMSKRNGEPVSVEGVALDELLDRLSVPVPDLVKIDVEGAEPDVLAGMPGILAVGVTDILLEANSRAALEQSRALLPAGYRCFAIDEAAGAVFDIDRHEAAAGADHGRNYFLTTRRSVAEITAALAWPAG